MESELKLKTARTLKWNTIDKVSSQVLYAVTGVIFGNVLSKSDFGLVGAMLVFQAFASLFRRERLFKRADSKKEPTETDYCSVLYFNLGMSIAIYAILWFCAPLIADIFGDERLVGLSRVMFLSFILNATAIVQTNRLMKQMTVAKIAIGNTIGLVASGIVGIWLAFAGFGAWAIVWQTIVLAAVKSGFLWLTSGWLPRARFHWLRSNRSFSVGGSVMISSFLNTVSLNIYSFVIGAYYNLSKLGCYTQADKWSKMGIMSMSQILTSSFLPVLSKFQDDKERFQNAMRKMNRFTAYLLFPPPSCLSHAPNRFSIYFFGTKWDEAIIMFQILMGRGIFVVLTSLYNNYILAIGRTKALVAYEIVKDSLMVAAIFITIPLGVTAMIWGTVCRFRIVLCLFHHRKQPHFRIQNAIDCCRHSPISCHCGSHIRGTMGHSLQHRERMGEPVAASCRLLRNLLHRQPNPQFDNPKKKCCRMRLDVFAKNEPRLPCSPTTTS